jgi:hypothetical protein
MFHNLKLNRNWLILAVTRLEQLQNGIKKVIRAESAINNFRLCWLTVVTNLLLRQWIQI